MTTPAWFSTVLRIALFALLTMLAQTYFWSREAPLALKVVVAAMGVAAALRPAAAMLLLAALVPFARTISNDFYSVPISVRFTEALLLAFLAGWIASRLRSRRTESTLPPGSVAGLLFAATLVASVLVEIGVLRYWKDYWWPYLRTVGVYFGRDYLFAWVDPRPWVGGINGFLAPQAAALYLEGLALTYAVHQSCVSDRDFRPRLVFASVGAAVGTAILSLWSAFEAWRVSGQGLVPFITTAQLAVLTTKVNTAGSYYVLFLAIAGALLWSVFRLRRDVAMWKPPAAGACLAVGFLLMLGAFWLTGSRAGLVALATVTGGGVVLGIISTVGKRKARSTLILVAVFVVAVGLLSFGLLQRASGGTDSGPLGWSLQLRFYLWEAASRMWVEAPVLGVGVGQFAARSLPYLSDGLRQSRVFGTFSAHNQFLQVAVELGLVGGVLFLVMLAQILWSALRVSRRDHDAVGGAAVAGLMAFLLTALVGQPLRVEVVAYPFWMMLGVALATGAPDGGRVFRPGVAWRRRFVTAFLVLLAVSVPVRVWQGRADVNLALAQYGVPDDWSTEGDEREYKPVRGEAAFFVYARTNWLDVPVRRDSGSGATSVEVDVILDGRLARRMVLADDRWQVAGFLVPLDKNRPYRRVDLRVTGPGGVPGAIRLGRPDAKHR